MITTFIPLQPYNLDLGVELGEGLEQTGVPEGIPSQAQYVAEYCSSSVSQNSTLTLNEQCCVGSFLLSFTVDS